MAKRWRITAYNGEQVVHDWVLHGRVHRRQVELLLSRLQARHLTDQEIIDGTTGAVDKLRPVLVTEGAALSTRGKPLYYTADEETD